MSSHREAPAISRDPVADSTDLYAFVSPDDPGTVTIISNYIPLEAPFGGPNFFEFGPDVRYRINIDNDGDGDADIIYEFAFETPGRQRRLVPVQQRPDPFPRQRELEPQAVLLGYAHQPRAPASSRRGPGVPAVQHRSVVDSGLRHARLAGDSRPPRRPDGVRRPAGRGLLCRPRVDLRPRQPAAVREPARDVRASVAGGRTRRQRDRQLQRALDRAQGPEVRPDPARLEPDQRLLAGLGRRRVGVGEPAGGHGARAVVGIRARGRRMDAGVAPRQPAVQ